MTTYIVNVSGGLSSFEALRRTIEKYGKDSVIPVFADVKGDPLRDVHAAPIGSNWDGEDDDLYRFLSDIEKLLDVNILRIKHPEGLGVWGVIFKERAISIRGTSIFAPCTKCLKQQTLDAFVATVPGEIKQVVGLSWMERDRIERLREVLGDTVLFPMNEAPFVDNCHIDTWLHLHGVESPSTYDDGFPHSNCGGACVKAGHAQWALLLKTSPGRYAYNEEQEDWFRRDINPNVSILRDRRNGTTTDLPLKVFRERIQSGDLNFNHGDFGGCACFTIGGQTRMDDLAIEAVAV